MSPLLAYTLCPSDPPPTKDKILNQLLYKLSEWAQDDFRAWKMINIPPNQKVICANELYTASIESMSDIYKIKFL